LAFVGDPRLVRQPEHAGGIVDEIEHGAVRMQQPGDLVDGAAEQRCDGRRLGYDRDVRRPWRGAVPPRCCAFLDAWR
jgi:hypothetical protein